MTFAKLDSGITKSSLWSESLHVRVVFLSFLAEKDETGFVSGSRSGLIRTCNVTPEQFDNAITVLSSPDPDSKTTDFEGRRIAKADGGYVVLNSDKYRLPENEKKEKHAEYMREWRANKVNVKSQTITNNHNQSPSVSVSVSVSDSDSISEEKSAEKRNKKEIESQIETIYQAYPKKKDKGHALKAISTALSKCQFEKLLDHVKKYAQSVVGKDPQFIPYPATWFNGLRWEDQEEVKTEKQLRDEALAKEIAEWGKKVAK